MTATTPFMQKPVITEDSVHAADTANVSSFIQQRVIHLRWRFVAEPVTAQEIQGPFHFSHAQSRRMLSPGWFFCPVPGALNPPFTLYLLPVPVRALAMPMRSAKLVASSSRVSITCCRRSDGTIPVRARRLFPARSPVPQPHQVAPQGVQHVLSNVCSQLPPD